MRLCQTSRLSWLLIFACGLFAPGPQAVGQAFSGGFRPFVTAITPIIGPNGQVGGVYVDAEGLVSRAEIDATGQLGQFGQIQRQPVEPESAEVTRASALRKISLRKLEAELIRLRDAGLPLTADIEFLAGLQRIEYVMVDPESKDIVLAGPAEGWRVGDHGVVVGEKTGLPVLTLGDLVITLRSGMDQWTGGITCSIDATPDGMENYLEYLATDPEFNEQTLNEMTEAIGNFEVTFSGVASDSHYARVLIAADVLMKRLAMNLETSPVRGVKSYIEMLQNSTRPMTQGSSPRWWLASDYEALLRDDAGLTWKISGPAVKTMTSQDFLDDNGVTVDTRNVNPLARRWADKFTEHYRDLSVELPVFGQLRNCMDLAVVGALLKKHDLPAAAGSESTVLTNAEMIELADYSVPKFTPPQISYAPGRRGWIVTVSGGIAIDAWSVTEIAQVDTALATTRQAALDAAADAKSWWWD